MAKGWGTLVFALCGCGAATPPPQPAADDAPAARSGETPSIGGEVGGLDGGAVESGVREAQSAVDRCVARGREKLPALGGTIELFVVVGGAGRAVAAYPTRSTLGDHATESCIAKAFRERLWPRPVGGDVGEIRQRFDYPSEPPPAEWTQDKLSTAMGADWRELADKLQGCRNEAHTSGIEVTMYLDEDGLVQTLGLAADDERGPAALDCVATTVQTTSFPSPHAFTKVTVAVR